MEGLEIEFEIGATTRRYDDDEVKAIWIGADKLDPADAAYSKLLLLLCVRKNELAGIRDSEFDDAEYPTVWTVPNSRTKSTKRKVDRIYLVPLPKLAQRIIKGLLRAHDDLLFPNSAVDGPMIADTDLTKGNDLSGVVIRDA